MRIFIQLSIICLIFASCSKSDPAPDNTPPPPPPPAPDTLTAGWTKTGAGVPATAYISDIFFTNNTTGYSTTDQGIYRSTDGGINWSIFNTVNTPNNISGLGNRYCFVGADNRIHRTNDGTDFFSNAYFTNDPTQPTLGFRDCFISSPTIVYACSGRYIYKSINGGANFDSIYVFPAGGGESFSIFFTSVTDGWLLRSTGLFKTTNGGTNWTVVPNFGGGFGLIDFLNPTTGLVSNSNAVYKTTDGGATWTPIFSLGGQVFIDVDMITANDIYLSGADQIFKSVNGGTSYTRVLSSAANGIVEIHFTDVNTGWACGRNGAIYRYKQ